MKMLIAGAYGKRRKGQRRIAVSLWFQTLAQIRKSITSLTSNPLRQLTLLILKKERRLTKKCLESDIHRTRKASLGQIRKHWCQGRRGPGHWAFLSWPHTAHIE